MTKSCTSQLGLFDSTSLGWGFDLGIGGTAGTRRHREPTPGDESVFLPTAPSAPPAPAPHVPAVTFRLTGDRALSAGWKARAADTIAAIRLARQIEDEARPATATEQAKLALFTGFGASELANSFFRRAGEAFRPGWEELGHALEQLVPAAEMAALARATQYAHYTPEFMIRAIWRAVTAMGFAGGSVLEPGCGTGLFLALMPEAAAAKSAITAIEMDPCTARIAKLLHPEAWVRQEDFTKAKLAETFDLVVGNPPFSDRTVRSEDPSGRLGLSLHEYFMARSIERLKPGGLGAFVCSRYAMDRIDPKGRAHIAGMADLLGAVRLPQGAMLAASGTEVVVDLLFFQRRAPGQEPAGAAWDEVVEVLPATDGEAALHANRYFAERPEMVLGTHAWTTSAYGPAYTCRRYDENLEADLVTAIDRLPRGVHQASPESAPVRTPADAVRVQVGTAAEGATVKEGSYVLVDDVLIQVLDGRAEPVAVKSGKGSEGMFAKPARIIRLMIPVREALREVLRTQVENKPWGSAQMALRVAYGAFVRAFGPINLTTTSRSTDPETGAVTETQRRPNLAPFADDPDCWLVASIEDYDPDSGTAKKGPVFSERVIHPPAEPVIVTAADALAVTLAEVGHVDPDRIAELLGRSRADTLAELGEAVFLDPERADTDGIVGWQTADAYLSGPVRSKLAKAEAAAVADPRFARNVEALLRVQPADLRPSDITARLGAPWLPASDIALFSQQVIGVETTIRHTVEIAAWSVDKRAFAGQAAATSEWGTARRHAGELLDDALHSSIPTIWDTWHDADGEHRQINAAETEAAKEKLGKIKAAFEAWVWTDPDRTDRLARSYNDTFNNLVPRHFDGTHLTLPGASSVIGFRPHQKRGVWRIICAGSTYLAHAVGAGKTFLMAAAIMEQRRLGLVSKAIVAGLMQNELCRALINVASGNPNLVPSPVPVRSNTPGNSAMSGDYVSWAYSMSTGDGVGGPVCGTVTLRQPNPNATNLAGVSVDMTAQQQATLTNILTTDIRPDAQNVAQQLWTTRQATSLNPLMNTLTKGTADYTSQLTGVASTVMRALRSGMATADAARGGSIGITANQQKLSDLGWTQAGAYYVEIARLNGQTLSLLSAVPMVGAPSYQGLGPSLGADLAPLVQSLLTFQTTLSNYVQTTDGTDVPGGNSDLFTGATPGEDGASAIEQVMRSLHLNERVLSGIVTAMSPTAGTGWTDPFAALIGLGQTLTLTALTALGLATLLASSTATAGSVAWSVLTLNFSAAAATVSGHLVMNFLGTPIFYGLMCLLVPGLLISYVLPMIPFAMWVAGVAGWLILVCEAVIAVPLWMFAHLTFQGDGLHGRGIEGYALLFNVLFRPVLMLFGLFLSYFVFSSMSWLIMQGFAVAAGFALSNGWFVTNMLGVVVLLCMFVLMEITLALVSFRLISVVPHQVVKLIGVQPANRVDMDQFGRDVGMVGMGASMRGIQGGTQSVLSSAARAGEGGGQRLLANGTGRAAAPGANAAGADTTLAAQADVAPPTTQEG